MGPVPGDDLVAPVLERAAQGADLDGLALVGHVEDELVDPRSGGRLVSVRVELTNRFLCMPGDGDLALRISRLQQADHLRLGILAQALLGHGEEPSRPEQRVTLSTPVPEGLVLHAPSALVELGVGVLHHVEGIGDERRLRERRGEHQAEGGGEVEGRPADPCSPLLASSFDPGRRLSTASTRHDV